VGDYLAAHRDVARGAAGGGAIAEMCFDEDCWKEALDRSEMKRLWAGVGE